MCSKNTSCGSCMCITFSSIFMFFLFFNSLLTDPSNIKFHVIDASLTQFNLTSNNTLYYNFRVDITVSPNKQITVYYTRIPAMASYKDNDFGWLSLAPFEQGHKNSTFLQAVFEGQSVIRLEPQQLDEYKEETSVGFYNDLAVEFELTFKAKAIGTEVYGGKPMYVLCRRSRVPLISNGKTAPPFSVTKCRTSRYKCY